jgi:alanine-glyoxylate transaminase/serine-glyoxylate transaminase/serine-pyruvate transaminase
MSASHSSRFPDLDPSPRLLLGPGPSMVHPRVLRAMATPLLGHLDPQFIHLMNEIQDLLRMVFETNARLVVPVSGTGSAGMEAALCNFIEPGDSVLICVAGYFGERMVDMAKRYGANVNRIDAAWGDVFSAKQVEEAVKTHRPKLVAIVHAETSTGALQPLEEIAEVVHKHGALLLVDAVTSLGGVPVRMDQTGIDICYSGTQKCLSCPPGLAPLAINERAEEVLKARKTPVANWYLDMTMIQKYWGSERTYHHTAPISMNYALREALRLVDEEGLTARFERHARNAQMLWDGLSALDLTLHVPAEHRLPSLTTVRVPDGVDEAAVRRRLLEEYNIEIAGGLGTLKGKIFRIGLMGFSSRAENVVTLLGALERILA